MIIRALTGYSTMSLTEFSTELNNVFTKMKNNPDFPTLQGQVRALETEAVIYSKLLALAHDGSKTAKLERDSIRALITNMLQNLGADVTAIARNRVRVFAGSGFRYNEPKKRTPLLNQPEPPQVLRPVVNGKIRVKTKRQKGMTSVVFLIATDPNGEWTSYPCSTVFYTFENLIRSQMYYIKVVMTGSRNQRVESDYVSAVAL